MEKFSPPGTCEGHSRLRAALRPRVGTVPTCDLLLLCPLWDVPFRDSLFPSKSVQVYALKAVRVRVCAQVCMHAVEGGWAKETQSTVEKAETAQAPACTGSCGDVGGTVAGNQEPGLEMAL